MKKIMAILLILTIVVNITSCTKVKKSSATTDSSGTAIVTSTDNPDLSYVPTQTFDVIPKKSIVPAKTYELQKNEYLERLEAENQGIAGLKINDEIDGYSGDGYVTGFKSISSLNIPAQVFGAGHYNITVCFYAKEMGASASLKVNSSPIGDFSPTKEKIYLTATFSELFLEQDNIITIVSKDGNINIDYIEISNSELTDIKPVSSTLSNSNATEETKSLMKYLTDNYGKKIITGQYVSSPQNLELNLLREKTSQYPAIRFGDMSAYTYDNNYGEVNSALDWALGGGGIVGEMWYWLSPNGSHSIYTADNGFNILNALTNIDISQKTTEEIEQLYADKKITQECYLILKDIDLISEKLKIFKDNNVPVLWRPLHEAGGQWFWWGVNEAVYKWLWSLLYNRMTNYHQLNNLIWIWNGQSKDYLVPMTQYDIASLDIYLRDETDFSSRSAQFKWLSKITEQKKLLAVSECGNLPKIDAMLRDKSMWSFFGLWYGEYISNSGFALTEGYNSLDDFYNIYNSEKSITLYDYVNR
ncbi:mannan endo-1,4-beta-mannosidase [Clostridia bacterium]|nr:mannan endo-1,4-beta-mannosidase [Clostridia bacterium]